MTISPGVPLPGVLIAVLMVGCGLMFTTIVVRGVSYSFRGRFLKGGVFAAADLDQDTPVLEGTLTKFKNGQKVAKANLKFTYFGGT